MGQRPVLLPTNFVHPRTVRSGFASFNGAKKATETMDEATEAAEAMMVTMEAVEEVTAATADPAVLGKQEARQGASLRLVVSHVQVGAAKECNDMEVLQTRPQRL